MNVKFNARRIENKIQQYQEKLNIQEGGILYIKDALRANCIYNDPKLMIEEIDIFINNPDIIVIAFEDRI